MTNKRSIVLVILFTLACTLGSFAADARAADAPPSAQSGAQAQRDPKRLWCNEHQAYEDECFICHPELREPGRLWCKEHGRYEDRCFLCHPELRDASRPFCEKHFLYQDECYLCDPKLKHKAAPSQGSVEPGGVDASASASKPLMCKEHGVAEQECGICHPELAATLEAGQGLKVRFASPDAARKAGIETAHPQRGEVSDGVECYAEITFNRNKVAQIAAPVAGVVRSVSADLGDEVVAGTVLATIASAEIGATVNAAVLAQQTLQRERRLFEQHISAKKELQAAEAAYGVAYDELRTLGFDEAQIRGLGSAGREPALLELRAPFAGEVVERNAVEGSRVETGTMQFVLADRSSMWAMLNIPEAELSRVTAGQKVELTVESQPGQLFVGTLTWIAPRVDERTRMAQARAEVANADRALRGETFARARIITATAGDALTVPKAAIQNVDGKPFAFVKLAEDVYEARAVRLGGATGDEIEIATGLEAEDDVVVANSYLVKSQLQISRLGAGCTD